jgi:hypothetical protein
MFRLTSRPSSGVIIQRIPSVVTQRSLTLHRRYTHCSTDDQWATHSQHSLTHPTQMVYSLFHRWPVSYTWSTLTHSLTHPAQTVHSLFHRWSVSHTWSTLTHSPCTDGTLTVPQMTSEAHMVHTHSLCTDGTLTVPQMTSEAYMVHTHSLTQHRRYTHCSTDDQWT